MDENDHELGDWRKWLVVRLKEDSHILGSKISKGRPLDTVIPTITKDKKLLTFVRPSPAALGLSAAIKAAKEALNIKSKINFKDVKTGGRTISNEHDLFDYFEKCMETITFSYQSVEVFCNEVIATILKDKTYQWEERYNKIEDLSADDLQRKVSTKNKIKTILPSILDLPCPKDKKWQDFRALEDLRNNTIHTKYHKTHNIGDMEKRTYYSDLIFIINISHYPLFAINIINHFARQYYKYASVSKTLDAEPRWLLHAKEKALAIYVP